MQWGSALPCKGWKFKASEEIGESMIQSDFVDGFYYKWNCFLVCDFWFDETFFFLPLHSHLRAEL